MPTPTRKPGTSGRVGTHRYIISYGHRNSNRGGAVRESEWTPLMGKRLQKAIIRRGGTAIIVHEHDTDSDPTATFGSGLQSVAQRAVALGAKHGPFDAYLSCHYGAEPRSGCFFIFPDARSGVDSKANNPLDVLLCRTFATHVPKTGMPARTGTTDRPGVQSERETGVGLKGHRLGEFVGTLGFRNTTARVILEGGDYTDLADRKRLWDMDWVDAYCEAIVDGLEEVFGTFRQEDAPAPKPEPTPEPTVPGEPVEPEPDMPYPEGMDGALARELFGEVVGPDGRTYAFNPSGPVSKAWMEEGNRSHQWPRLVDVEERGLSWYFVFGNGLVIWIPDVKGADQGAVSVLGR